MSTSSASALSESAWLLMISRSRCSASFRANWARKSRAAVSKNSDRLLYSPMCRSMASMTSFDSVMDVLIFILPIYYRRWIVSTLILRFISINSFTFFSSIHLIIISFQQSNTFKSEYSKHYFQAHNAAITGRNGAQRNSRPCAWHHEFPQLSSCVFIPCRWDISPHVFKRQESPHTEKLLTAALNSENRRGSLSGMPSV